MATSNGDTTFSLRQRLGLVFGIPLFVLVLLLPRPENMSPEAHKTLAIAILMALWWITEAVPIPATALIPLVAYPALGIMKAKEVAPSYGDSNIFLFMGGFFLAMTMQKWGLHRRIALHIIRIIGTGPKRIVLGFMVATAVISMWISNTATTMMMYPIGLAIIMHVVEMGKKEGINYHEGKFHFDTALMLGIAYAASIGGIGTLVGTPPNIVFVSQLKTIFPKSPEIGFLQWMTIGVPLVAVFLPFTWLYLTRVVLPVRLKEIPGGKEVIAQQLQELGKTTKAERYTLYVFLLTAMGWIFRKNINLGFFTIPGWSNLAHVAKTVNDSTVAIFAAVLLFLIPVNLKKGEFLLDWRWAIKIPWGILILFGGGIALANGFKTTGLAAWIGSNLSLFSAVPVVVMILITCGMLTFLTEITSNTATSTIFMPILAATAVAMKAHPLLLMIPATISASCAFMLPVATPPNAIIFGSGHVSVPQMAKAGVGLNFIGVVLVTTIVYLVAIPLFGISVYQVPFWAH